MPAKSRPAPEIAIMPATKSQRHSNTRRNNTFSTPLIPCTTFNKQQNLYRKRPSSTSASQLFPHDKREPKTAANRTSKSARPEHNTPSTHLCIIDAPTASSWAWPETVLRATRTAWREARATRKAVFWAIPTRQTRKFNRLSLISAAFSALKAPFLPSSRAFAFGGLQLGVYLAAAKVDPRFLGNRQAFQVSHRKLQRYFHEDTSAQDTV